MAECVNCRTETKTTTITHITNGLLYGPFCSAGCRDKHQTKIVEGY